jgi:hypothetical protein
MKQRKILINVDLVLFSLHRYERVCLVCVHYYVECVYFVFIDNHNP